MVHEFRFRGRTFDELKAMKPDDFADLTNARIRRSIKKGFTEQQKKLLMNIDSAIKEKQAGKEPKPIKTHERDTPILPSFVGLRFGIHNGKEFQTVEITEDMIGHFLGEFALTRRRVQHGTPGVGASRSSKFVPIK
jgi:small subunit ribosomal protein S19